MVAARCSTPREHARPTGRTHPRLPTTTLARRPGNHRCAKPRQRIRLRRPAEGHLPRRCADATGLMPRDAGPPQGMRRQIPVHVLIETPGALREAWQIAAPAGGRVARFRPDGFRQRPPRRHPGQRHALAGAVRASADRARQVRNRRRRARQRRGAGAQRHHRTRRSSTWSRDDARRARQEFGFLRMWSIHPNQIQPIVEAMRPTFAEVDGSRRHPAAAARTPTGARSRCDGRLHDRASYRYYWDLLQRAHATGADCLRRTPDRVSSHFLH